MVYFLLCRFQHCNDLHVSQSLPKSSLLIITLFLITSHLYLGFFPSPKMVNYLTKVLRLISLCVHFCILHIVEVLSMLLLLLLSHFIHVQLCETP